jgi:hypothetical protein
LTVSYDLEEPAAIAAAVVDVCITRLCSLQSFSGEAVRPSSLACLTGLRELRLRDINGIIYAGAAPDAEQQGARELLAALQHLTQLQHLELKRYHLHSLEPQPRQQEQQGCDSLSCFSALTASTQLTALAIHQWNDVPVPQAAFDHIFPSGRALPHLKVLSLTGFRHCVEAAQVVRIAASCPALQELTLHGVTPRGFDVSCLLQLPPGVERVKGLGWTRLGTDLH